MTDTDSTFRFDSAYKSGAYRQRWHYSHPSPELVALVASGIAPTGARVLDAGCGAGTESLFLARCGFVTLGVDLSEPGIAIARAAAIAAAENGRNATEDSTLTGSRLEFQVADVTALPADDETFAFINDRGVFHVFDEAGRAAYAAELTRVLAPGGAIAIRGTRIDPPDGRPIKAITEASIDRHFPATRYTRGPLVPIQLIADTDPLDGVMVVLRKRQRPARTDGGVQVEGIGGVFFKADDPKALVSWYARHLGVPVDEHGFVDFRWRPLGEPGRPAQTVWSAFKRDTRYFDPGTADHMLNYRVADLHQALARLRADGVQVMDEVDDSEYGKFGWCLDPEGNKIELWQPPS